MNILVNVLTNLRNNVRVGNRSFIQRYHSRFVREVLQKLVDTGYLTYVKQIPASKKPQNRLTHLEIGIAPILNNCAGVSPQFVLRYRQIEQMEQRFLPAVEIGLLLLSTTQGIRTNRELRLMEQPIGGKLLGYVF